MLKVKDNKLNKIKLRWTDASFIKIKRYYDCPYHKTQWKRWNYYLTLERYVYDRVHRQTQNQEELLYSITTFFNLKLDLSPKPDCFAIGFKS